MEHVFVKFSNAAAALAGRSWTFVFCLGLVLTWAVWGPFFHFSETWQLVINTGTTIITFLMVFLIQNTQNRDGAAMQAKLDELVFAMKQADSRFIGIEHLTEQELDTILREVEARGLEVHAGKPARAIRGRPGRRAEDVEASQPPAATPAKERKAPPRKAAST